MRLQPIENLSKTYSGDPHLGQTKLNGLLLLTIHGVLGKKFLSVEKIYTDAVGSVGD